MSSYLLTILGILFVLACFHYVGAWVSARSILRWQQAVEPVGDEVWTEVEQRLAKLARKARIPSPRIYVIHEYAPNAFVLPGRTHNMLVMSEGLVQSLTEKELDAVLSLCLAQIRTRDFRRGAQITFFLYPLISFLERLPAPFFVLISPIPAMLVRFFHSPKRCYKADRFASNLCGAPLVLAASLQKIAALSKKIPLENWSLCMDHLYLVSPIQGAGIPFFPTHPRVDDRIEKILKLRS
jgi:heat shock protein HtpX